MSRLSSLLRIRNVQERQRLAEVARAEAELAAAERELQRRREERFSWAVPAGQSLASTQLRRAQIEGIALVDAEAAADARASAAARTRDHAQERWSQSRVALRSVERLAEYRAATLAADAAARAQAQADELALLMRRREP